MAYGQGRGVVVALAKLLLRLMSLLPRSAPMGLARTATPILFRLSPGKRRTTLVNLKVCFPGLDEQERTRLAEESFRHYLASVLEAGRNWYWPVPRLRGLCDGVVGENHLRACLDSDRGFLVLTPHFGAWEYLGIYMQDIPGIRILYKPPSNPDLDRVLFEMRGRGGATMIPATRGAVRQLYAHVGAGGCGGLLPDQVPNAGQGGFAPFFGFPALTGVLVSRLARRTGCNVLFLGCERRPGGRYRVHFLPADEEIGSADDTRSLTALNRGVEQIVSIDPAQYLWSYRRFKVVPEGMKSPYR
jgi:KDO2-lipid IV(A) lauroyltransferase